MTSDHIGKPFVSTVWYATWITFMYHFREASKDELEKLRRQYNKSEAARRELEKRVKEAGTMQQRLLMACTVG